MSETTPEKPLPKNRLIEYVAVFGIANQTLKKKIKTVQNEKTLDEKLKIGFVPSVLHRYPETDKGRSFPFPPQISTFSWPKEHVEILKEQPGSRFFSFCLTSTDGERFFSFCFTKYFRLAKAKTSKMYGTKEELLYEPSTICVISKHPFHEYFKDMLFSLDRYLLSGRTKRFSLTTIKKIYSLFAAPFNRRLKVNILGKKTIMFNLDSKNDFPTFNANYLKFVDIMHPENVVKLLEYMLNESKILVVGKNMEHLTIIMECLRSFLYPFSYPYCYINLLPSHLYHFLEYPGTFFFGVEHHSFHAAFKDGTLTLPKNCALYKLDTDMLSFLPDPNRIRNNEILEFPKYIRKKLLSDLHKYYRMYRSTPLLRGTINPQKEEKPQHLYYYFFRDDSLFEEEINIRFSKKKYVTPTEDKQKHYAHLAAKKGKGIFKKSKSNLKQSIFQKSMNKNMNMNISSPFKNNDNNSDNEKKKKEEKDIKEIQLEALEDDEVTQEGLLELRAIFVDAFVSIFKQYEVFLLKPRSSTRTESGFIVTQKMLFDDSNFLLSFRNFGSQSRSLRSFLQKFFKTQLFLTFLRDRSPYLKFATSWSNQNQSNQKSGEDGDGSQVITSLEDGGGDAFKKRTRSKMRNITNQLLGDRRKMFKCFCWESVGSGKKQRLEMRQIDISTPISSSSSSSGEDCHVMMIYKIRQGKTKQTVHKLKIQHGELDIQLLIKSEWKQNLIFQQSNEQSKNKNVESVSKSKKDKRLNINSGTFERFPFLILSKKKRIMMSLDSFEDLSMLYRVIKSRLMASSLISKYRELYIEDRFLLRQNNLQHFEDFQKINKNNNDNKKKMKAVSEEEVEGEEDGEVEDVMSGSPEKKESNPVIRFLYFQRLNSYETLDISRTKAIMMEEEEEEEIDDKDWRESVQLNRS